VKGCQHPTDQIDEVLKFVLGYDFEKFLGTWRRRFDNGKLGDDSVPPRGDTQEVIDLFDGYSAWRSFKFTSGTASVIDVSVSSHNDWTNIVGKVYSNPTKIPSWEKHLYEYIDLTYSSGMTRYFGNKTTDYEYFIIVFEGNNPVPIRNFFDEWEKRQPDVHTFLGSISLLASRIYMPGQFYSYTTSVSRDKTVSPSRVLD